MKLFAKASEFKNRQTELMIVGAFMEEAEYSLGELQQVTTLRAPTIKRALGQMEFKGLILRRWDNGPWPRRVLYRLAYPIVQRNYVRSTEVQFKIMGTLQMEEAKNSDTSKG